MDEFFYKQSCSAASLDGGNNSPRFRQTLSSPWAQVVRGEAADSASTATCSVHEQVVITQSPELTGSGKCWSQTLAVANEIQVVVESAEEGVNVGGESKEAVWNEPLKVVPANTPVMEPARPLPNSSSASSSKPVSDVSSTKLVPDQEPVISNTQNNANANVNTDTNSNHSHEQFNRQNWNKRGISGTVGGGYVGFMRPPPSPLPPPLPRPFPMFGFPYPNLVSPLVNAPIRGEGPDKPNNARLMGNQFSYWNHSRGGNFGGGRPRGGGVGPYANSFRGNGPRGYMPHLMVPPPPHAPWGFFRSPHPGAPPFSANPIGFDMPFRSAPSLMPHAAPMFFPVMESPRDPPLTTKILNQIEYYFSESNLVTDGFLKGKMDGEAWVPISLIAAFPRVVRLTKGMVSRAHSNDGHIKLILESLRNSTVVEVQGDRLRPRKDWERWVPNLANGAGQGGPSDSSPSMSFQELVIDDATTKLNTNAGLSDASSSSEQRESTSTSKLTNGELIGEEDI